ncbi:Asp-tRNA(Asn)/Glu-tRNA(Gln) amidotransferase GatCAB subunit B, partial [Candidatus Roizmanbacteria bacterium CG10_big_fil_rev_8_21_14_0_10_39_6]
MTTFTPIIGLETHIELTTKTKMFCRCPAEYFNAQPNTSVCPVCLGLPGAMPIANARAIEWTIKLGIALDCTITMRSYFERKHYFYPDLPKGYQISQYQSPLCENGSLTLPNSNITIPIRRIHLEEDTGKLLHDNNTHSSLIDFNRSGVPLVEVVTEPAISDSRIAVEYLQTLQKYVQYLGISDA